MSIYMIAGYVDEQWDEVHFDNAIALLMYLEHHSVTGMTLKCDGEVIGMGEVARDARREVDEADRKGGQ